MEVGSPRIQAAKSLTMNTQSGKILPALCFFFSLQNMAYQADDVTKNKILEVLGPEQLFRLAWQFSPRSI